MHVTETVESRCYIESERKLSYEQLEKLAEEARVKGRLTCAGVTDIKIFCEEAKPGGSNAIAR